MQMRQYVKYDGPIHRVIVKHKDGEEISFSFCDEVAARQFAVRQRKKSDILESRYLGNDR